MIKPYSMSSCYCVGGVKYVLVLQWLQLEEAEWSEQLENLKGDSHTKSASSENQDPAGGGRQMDL